MFMTEMAELVVAFWHQCLFVSIQSRCKLVQVPQPFLWDASVMASHVVGWRSGTVADVAT